MSRRFTPKKGSQMNQLVALTVVQSERPKLVVLAKCSTLFVAIVAKLDKSLSNRQVTDQFFVLTASKPKR
jgi:hypothetical protein